MEEKNPKLWDCNSTLYDSFELNSFNRRLHAAISANTRSTSMPRLSDPAVQPLPAYTPKKQSRVARSLNRLLRSVFRRKIPSNTPWNGDWHVEHGFYCTYPESNSLTTIPEVSEKTFGSPELDAVVRKTASDRFSSTTVAGRLVKTQAS